MDQGIVNEEWNESPPTAEQIKQDILETYRAVVGEEHTDPSDIISCVMDRTQHSTGLIVDTILQAPDCLPQIKDSYTRPADERESDALLRRHHAKIHAALSDEAAEG